LIRQRINPDLKLLGVLPTLVQANTPFAMSAIAEIRSVFKNKVFDTFIPTDEIAAMAPAVRKSALDYRPDSAVAIAYEQLAEEVYNVYR
jgi:chromosome partitioning protein